MVYVTIKEDGSIGGVYTMPQPQFDDYAEIDDKDPRISEFLNINAKEIE